MIDFDSSSSSDDLEIDGIFGTTKIHTENLDSIANAIVRKPKPPYNWNLTYQLMQRENNITNCFGHHGHQTFAQGYYGARQVVENLTLASTLRSHTGRVNSLNFNRTGDLICSGLEDLNIIIWDWARQKILHCIKSGHTSNIYQTKFVNNNGCLDIVSSSRDGQVRLALIPPSGTIQEPTFLYSHDKRVRTIVMVPQIRQEVLSAGDDGAVKHLDLRTMKVTTLARCYDLFDNPVRLYSISHHPYAPEFCVCSNTNKIFIFDKRRCSLPVHEMCPKSEQERIAPEVTCAVYNHSGSEILASYKDSGVYLFDSRNYKDGETLHCYKGHLNNFSLEGANFFGPNSEYIVSGSDCGRIFFWNKNTESIINFMRGDNRFGECVEPHPWIPMLATAGGIEKNIKLWTPSGECSVPTEEELKTTVLDNLKTDNYWIQDLFNIY